MPPRSSQNIKCCPRSLEGSTLIIMSIHKTYAPSHLTHHDSPPKINTNTLLSCTLWCTNPHPTRPQPVGMGTPEVKSQGKGTPTKMVFPLTTGESSSSPRTATPGTTTANNPQLLASSCPGRSRRQVHLNPKSFSVDSGRKPDRTCSDSLRTCKLHTDEPPFMDDLEPS